MTDAEHDAPGHNLDHSKDDLNAVSTLLDACEKYPAVYEAVLEALGPETFKRDFTPTMIPTIRQAMKQGQGSPLEGLEDLGQPSPEPELDLPRLFAHASDDTKWLIGLIIREEITTWDQDRESADRHSLLTFKSEWNENPRRRANKDMGVDAVRRGLNELKVVLRGGLA